MRKFSFLLLIILFPSCARTNSNGDITLEAKDSIEIAQSGNLYFIENHIVNIEEEYILETYLIKERDVRVWHDINPPGIILNEFMDIFHITYTSLGRNRGYQRRSEWLRYFEAILKFETPMYERDYYGAPFIKNLPPQTEIIILAQNNLRDNHFYLIRTKGDTKLWSGWIHNSFVSSVLNTEIDDIRWGRRPGERRIKMLSSRFSTRNDVFAIQTGWMGEFIVVRNTGEIIAKLTQREINEIAGSAPDSSIIGWSKDNTKIWFENFVDTWTTSFGIIDIDRNRFIILDIPKEFSSASAIDFETGYILFDDFTFQHDYEGRRAIWESGQIFHLYSYNLFTRELQLIDTNVGEGFRINFKQEYGFTHERLNHFRLCYE